jgi:biotin carboxylase
MSRRVPVLCLNADKYVLDVCERHDVEPVVVMGNGMYDFGLMHVPDGVRVLRAGDVVNPESVLGALHRAGLGDHAFAAVLTSDEQAVVSAGVLGGHLGARAIDPGTGLLFRDKYLQKVRIAAAGLPTARTTVIDDIYDVSAVTGLPYARAVLKPVAGLATLQTSVITSVDALRARSTRFRRERIAERTFVLEEYVDGDEWVADGIVFDGEVVFFALGTYATPCLTAVDNGLPLRLRRFDPERESWAYERGEPTVRAAIAALGLRDGAFHLEMFHDPVTGVLTFGECAARRGGALIHEEMQAKFNVHMGEATLLSGLGRRPAIDVKIRPGAVGGAYLLGRPGTFIHCPSPAEMLELPGVEYVRIEFAFGTQLGDEVGSTNDRIGQVLVAADSEDALERRLAEVIAWFDERLIIAPHGVPMREQRAWQRATWPKDDFRDPLWR